MIGKPCKLTARWGRGAPPAPGQFIKSQSPRARYAYEITAVKRIDPTKNKGRYNYRLTCVRWQPSEVPAEATVHLWVWDKR